MCLLEFNQGSLTEGKRLSTVDLLVLTSLDQLLFYENIIFLFYKTSYLNWEVNRTEPSPFLVFPGLTCIYMQIDISVFMWS